ncbi:MAG: diadenylate cyclase CdaA [Clostridiales bacterium]|jgi:diadenylate cyclase|nr:diadenylate cyclase CdaA [Clostridiales bacterium]
METKWHNFIHELENLTWHNYLEIVLLAFVVFVALKFLKKNNALRLAKYILSLIIIGIILNSKLVREHFLVIPTIIANFILFAFTGIIILFPQELRRVMWRLSSHQKNAVIYGGQYQSSESDLRKAVSELVRSVQNMSKKNIGALIVIVPDLIAEQVIESGTMLNAHLTGALLESIFITKGPLHDGAVIIKGDKLISAGCFLPLTQDQNISKELGTRHRAGIGVTENSHVLSIICSEETGVISVAREGKLKSYYDGPMLQDILEQIFGLKVNYQNYYKNYGKFTR